MIYFLVYMLIGMALTLVVLPQNARAESYIISFLLWPMFLSIAMKTYIQSLKRRIQNSHNK